MEQIATTDDLIETLGGTKEAAEFFGVQPGALSNWKKRGIPARFQMPIWQEAQRRGIDVGPALFSGGTS